MNTRTLSLLAIALLVPVVGFGALLGNPIDFPAVFFNSFGTTSYTAATGSFQVTGAIPSSLFLDSTTSAPIAGGTVTIDIVVDDGGALVGGGAGHDFELTGTVDLGALGIFSGVLLTGEVTGFGFQISATPTHRFDFRFTATGGQLAFLYPDIGVDMTSENSTFTDFESNFSGEAKGTIGFLPGSPPVCDVLIDKTCCIPPPPTTASSTCDGGVTRLLLEFTGDNCSATSNTQEGSAKCTGDVGTLPADIAITGKDAEKYTADAAMVTSVGEMFQILPTAGESKLKSNTRFSIGGQSLEIHTSCSKPLNPGDQFGSVRVIEFESVDGGLAALPPAPDANETMCVSGNSPPGTECTARPVEVVFEYAGAACNVPLDNSQSDKAKCSGDPVGALDVAIAYVGKDPAKITVSPASMVNVGDIIRLTATGRDELHSNTKLNVIDSTDATVLQALEIHTSCSQPLALGDEFGALRIVEFTDKNGVVAKLGDPDEPVFQDACEVPSAPMGPHCTTKVESLTLRYIGGDCTISNIQEGKATCVGGTLGAPATIGDFSDSKFSATPATIDNVGDLVLIETTDDHFPSQTTFTVTDGSLASQTISFHTSCSKPLNLGDRFGAFEVFAIDRENDGTASLGGVVEYQYTVTNPNPDAALITVDDDILGNIVMNEAFGPGETRTFVRKATIFGTTTNTGKVTADLGGQMCMADDNVTITVVEPPPPPFDCTKPISSLTMIWDGAGAVDIKAYKGSVGSELIGDIGGILLGDEVTVDVPSGAPNDLFWEVFESGTMNKLGESKFHISCSDPDMNGVEDCGKNQGDGKHKGDEPSGFINDWLLEGIVDATSTLNCTVP